MRHPKDIELYGKYFSEKKFGRKMLRAAKKAGSKTVYAAFLLYYVMRSHGISNADKAIIYGALGYFIFPLDLLPDFIPFIGFADDFSAIAWALHTVWKNITPEIRSQAAARTREWFSGFESSPADSQLAK